MNRCNGCIDCEQGRQCAFSWQVTRRAIGEVLCVALAFALVVLTLGLTH